MSRPTTTFRQTTILYHRLTAPDCPLRLEITGTVYRESRPNSGLEDVVINALPVTGDQFQQGVANVNIYVPDLEVNGTWVANEKRLDQLTQLALLTLAEGDADEYSFWLESQQVFDEPEPHMHYSNLRIEFRHYTNL